MSTIRRLVRESLRPAAKTALWLLAIMVPVSLAVTLLDYLGALSIVARPFHGVFRFLGLPGESALVFLTSIALNIYSAIAVMGSLGLTGREMTILALMCLIAHNFFVEIAVVRRTGSSAVAMVILRLSAALAGALALNLILPGVHGQPAGGALPAEPPAAGARGDPIAGVLSEWLLDTVQLVATVAAVIVVLTVLTRVLDHYGVIRRVSRVFRPMFRVFGLPEQSAFLWFVANTLGLAYGAAVMIDSVESGAMDRETGDLLNHHLVISHSLLEDTLLFVALGVGAIWIVVPRLVLATAAVWIRRLFARARRSVV